MFQGTSEGTLVVVWVVPGAKRSAIVGRHGDALKIRVAAPAEAGKANAAMLRLLSDETGAPCTLVKGAGARQKTVLVGGVAPQRCAEALGFATGE